MPDCTFVVKCRLNERNSALFRPVLPHICMIFTVLDAQAALAVRFLNLVIGLPIIN